MTTEQNGQRYFRIGEAFQNETDNKARINQLNGRCFKAIIEKSTIMYY